MKEEQFLQLLILVYPINNSLSNPVGGSEEKDGVRTAGPAVRGPVQQNAGSSLGATSLDFVARNKKKCQNFRHCS